MRRPLFCYILRKVYIWVCYYFSANLGCESMVEEETPEEEFEDEEDEEEEW